MSVALDNMDYYIRYEFARVRFAEEVYSLSQQTIEHAKNNSDNDWITLWYYNNSLLKLFKDYFDEAYFNDQIMAGKENIGLFEKQI